MKALLFAAGKGTRLKPFTDNHPKALVPVNGKALLERNIRYLQSFGINQFVINIHHFGEQIIEFLNQKNNFGAEIDISDERAELLETGGGLLFAKKFLEKEKQFLIMNADILTNMDIGAFLKYHNERNAEVTLAVSDRKSSRKLLFTDEMKLMGWENLQTGEQKKNEDHQQDYQLAFSGIHCVNSSFFNKIKRDGKFSIMEEYMDLMYSDNIIGYKHEAYLVDVGRPESVATAERYFK